MASIHITTETMIEIRLMGVEATKEIYTRLAACGQVNEIEGRLMRAYSMGFLAGQKMPEAPATQKDK